MFETSIESLENDRVIKYLLTEQGQPISFARTIALWQTDAEFRSRFIQMLAAAPFEAFRWETPPVTASTAGRDFEFVLIYAPGFNSRSTDDTTFEEYFTDDDCDQGIVAFENVGKDATLIVPSPRMGHHAYGHLAAFIRHSPAKQAHALWQVVGKTMASKLGPEPIWLNTAGGGVAWLHVRLDSRPKYYGFVPYKHAQPDH